MRSGKTFWIRSSRASVFVSSAKPGFDQLGDWHTINRTLDLFARLSSTFQTRCCGQASIPQSLLAIVCTPSLTVLYPYKTRRVMTKPWRFYNFSCVATCDFVVFKMGQVLPYELAAIDTIRNCSSRNQVFLLTLLMTSCVP
jgi:hypothetical protein